MRRLAIIVVAFSATLLFAQSAKAEPTVVFDCSPAPRDCSVWYRTNVSINWTVVGATQPLQGCVDTTLTTDTRGALQVCAAADNSATVIKQVRIKIDKTRPRVTGAAASRPPDANGWYRAPVGVAFRGADATSGLRSCTTTAYSGPDTATARLRGACTDVAGNTSTFATFGLRYDSTRPVVTRGRPARKPDHRRWYNHPVRWRFRGRDSLSGLSACPSVLFRGGSGHVIGACRDNAGNIGLRGFRIRYDATPPAPPRVRAVPRDRRVKLNIGVTPDVRRIAVVRSPGLRGARDSTLYKGRPRNFTDWRVRNGKRYRYTVIARDQAANRSRTTVRATPRVRLLAPPDGAAVAAPPLLRWSAVHDADYYNVQLRRDGRKVLSRWPERPRLQLAGTWHFGGQVRHLSPGTYTWDVWPGFGARSQARYGRRIGSRTFVIPAPLAQ